MTFYDSYSPLPKGKTVIFALLGSVLANPRHATRLDAVQPLLVFFFRQGVVTRNLHMEMMCLMETDGGLSSVFMVGLQPCCFLEGIQNPEGNQKTTQENAFVFEPLVRNFKTFSSLPNINAQRNNRNKTECT
jgi:hypothetical protein